MQDRAVRVVEPGSGETVLVVGDTYRFLVTGAESGGTYMVMEATIPAGHGPPMHVHSREDEGFYVLEGEVDFDTDDGTVRLGPGSQINLPKGVRHRFENRGTATARLLITCAPAGIEDFFREASGVNDPPRLIEIAARHGLTIFPPAEAP